MSFFWFPFSFFLRVICYLLFLGSFSFLFLFLYALLFVLGCFLYVITRSFDVLLGLGVSLPFNDVGIV